MLIQLGIKQIQVKGGVVLTVDFANLESGRFWLCKSSGDGHYSMYQVSMRIYLLNMLVCCGLLSMNGVVGQEVRSEVDELRNEIAVLKRENRELKAMLARETADGNRPEAAILSELDAPSAMKTNPAAGAFFDATGKLSKSYADAVLIIEGDQSVGTGFVVKDLGKTYLYTAAHVLSGNSRFTIKTSSGGRLSKFGKMETAVGADLARIGLLEESPWFKIGKGDEVVQINLDIAALGNGGGAGVMAVELGKILGTSGDNIEVDAKIIQGNSGGPVVDVKTGKVLGVATHLTAAKKDIWAEGTRQGEVRRFACRLDRDWNWKPVVIGKFLAEGKLVADFDNVTRLCYAITMLEPGSSGMRFDLEVGGNYSAAQIFEANKKLPLVQDLYQMNRDLAAKKIAVSAMDLRKRFRSTIARTQVLANADENALDPGGMSWFHAKNAEDSVKFRRAAIERLNERYEELE